MNEEVTTVKQITKVVSENLSKDSFNDIIKEADLFPRLLKYARRGKKQSHEEISQPIEVQPNRIKSKDSNQ